MKQKHGMNPVTLRQEGRRSPITATLMRMGLGTEDNMRHIVTIALGNEEAEKVLGLVQVPQDKFIDAVGRLFPRGELDGANLEEGPEDRDDLLKELSGLEDLTRDEDKPFPSKSAYYTAMARLHRIRDILNEMEVRVCAVEWNGGYHGHGEVIGENNFLIVPNWEFDRYRRTHAGTSEAVVHGLFEKLQHLSRCHIVWYEFRNKKEGDFKQ